MNCLMSAALAILASVGVGHAYAAWTVTAGDAPLEQTAAADLREELAEHAGDGTIFIGTPDTDATIAAEHAREPFRLDPAAPESFHLRRHGDRVFVVGVLPKGAMSGAFRLLDIDGMAEENLDVAVTPTFRYRIAGHKVNQSPPPGWSEEDQARFYVRHGINVVWGEKKAPPLSYETRKKYGLGVMQELRFPSSATPEWWSDPASADAAYFHKVGSDRRVISPFGDAGRVWYLKGYRKLLEDNPDTRVLYAIFGDYNAIPGPDSVRISDGEPYAHTREETMLEILGIMREAIGNRDITPKAWLWHAFFGDRAGEIAFMHELAERGFGLMYNEAGNSDDWIFKLDNFDDQALLRGDDGKLAWGEEYLSLVSAGGACESVNPVIAMPLPRVAAYKLARLANAGVRDVVLWWGSGEGWAYQPNLAALNELVWSTDVSRYAAKDFPAVEPLLHRIAARDFGVAVADDVVAYWRAFDEVLVTDRPIYRPASVDVQGDPTREGLRVYDWYQRMGTYTEPVFGGAFPEPITPHVLASPTRFRHLAGWGAKPYAVANYEAVIAKLIDAEAKLESIVDSANPVTRPKLASMLRWSSLYRLLLTAQSHHLRGLLLMKEHAGADPSDSAVRAAITPLVDESIANTQAIIDLARTFPPNFNLTGSHETVVQGQGDRDAEIEKLAGKLAAMRVWRDGLTNLALGRPVTASSHDASKTESRGAKNAVDGDPATLWASTYSDDQWITVDLGERCRLELVLLTWKTGYASAFEVQVATGNEPNNWSVVHHTNRGVDGAMTITLPEDTVARFVRIQGLKRGSPFGYALREIELYGEGLP